MYINLFPTRGARKIVYSYIHTYTYSYIYTHTQTYTYAYIYKYVYVYTHVRIYGSYMILQSSKSVCNFWSARSRNSIAKCRSKYVCINAFNCMIHCSKKKPTNMGDVFNSIAKCRLKYVCINAFNCMIHCSKKKPTNMGVVLK